MRFTETNEMEIKVKNLMQIFNGSKFSIYCKKTKCEELYSSNYGTRIPRAIMELTVLSCEVKDGIFCIGVDVPDSDI